MRHEKWKIYNQNYGQSWLTGERWVLVPPNSRPWVVESPTGRKWTYVTYGVACFMFALLSRPGRSS